MSVMEHMNERDRELSLILGEMLEHAAGRIRATAEQWMQEGRDPRDMVILLLVRGDGSGAVISKSRTQLIELADEPTPLDSALLDTARKVIDGPRDCIPAVFIMEHTATVHLTWIEPVHSSEVH